MHILWCSSCRVVSVSHTACDLISLLELEVHGSEVTLIMRELRLDLTCMDIVLDCKLKILLLNTSLPCVTWGEWQLCNSS